MFIAMNRFKVIKAPKQRSRTAGSRATVILKQCRGFVEFQLLKGPEADDHTLYASHTVWKNRSTFEAWTKSEAFRAAHASAGGNLGTRSLRGSRRFRR